MKFKHFLMLHKWVIPVVCAAVAAAVIVPVAVSFSMPPQQEKPKQEKVITAMAEPSSDVSAEPSPTKTIKPQDSAPQAIDTQKPNAESTPKPKKAKESGAATEEQEAPAPPEAETNGEPETGPEPTPVPTAEPTAAPTAEPTLDKRAEYEAELAAIEEKYISLCTPIENALREIYVRKAKELASAGPNAPESVLNGIRTRYEEERRPYMEQKQEIDAWHEAAVAELNAKYGY